MNSSWWCFIWFILKLNLTTRNRYIDAKKTSLIYIIYVCIWKRIRRIQILDWVFFEICYQPKVNISCYNIFLCLPLLHSRCCKNIKMYKFMYSNLIAMSRLGQAYSRTQNILKWGYFLSKIFFFGIKKY